MNYLRHCGSDCAAGVMLTGSLAGIVPRPPPPDPEEIDLPPPQGDSRVDNYQQLFDNAEWVARVMTFEEAPADEAQQRELTIVMMPPLVRRAMGPGLALDNQDIVADLELPILFVHGEKDTSVPATSVAAAMAVLPEASSVMIPNSGHSPFAEATEEFNRTLMEFAQRVRRGER